MSKLEQMAYKIQPAGHDEQQPKRKYETPNKLKEAYEKWLTLNNYANHDEVSDNQKKCFDNALELTKKLEFRLSDVNALLLEYIDDLKPHLTGLFASALYQRIPEKEIIFDLQIEQALDFVGFALPKDKTLISKIRTGEDLGTCAAGTIINTSFSGLSLGLGQSSTGIIINYGKTTEYACTGAKSLIINYGICGDHFADGAKNIIINAGKTENHFAEGCQGIAINFGAAGHSMGGDLPFPGMLINYGKIGRFLGPGAEGRILCFKAPQSYDENITQALLKKPGQCAKYVQLRQYLDNLKVELEKGRNDYKAAIKLADQLDKKEIEETLPDELIEERDLFPQDDFGEDDTEDSDDV